MQRAEGRDIFKSAPLQRAPSDRQALWFAALGLGVAVSLPGCAGPGPKELAYDLARRAAFAERVSAPEAARAAPPDRGAPAAFSILEEGGVPSLVLVGGSSVRYALRLPREGELRFRPDLHPTARKAGGAASFRVTLESAAGQERELWSRVIRSSEARPEEVRLRLPDDPGAIVRVALHLAAASGQRFAWGTFTAPRVLGRPSAAVPAAASAAADALRTLAREMNVLLVVLDSARARQFSCYGYERATTPEIDRIAREGVLFEQAITPAVYTLGAMASVWTSQPPHLHRAGAAYASALPRSALTLAEVLSGRGAHSVAFVGNPMAGRGFGLERGFSEFHQRRDDAAELIGRVSEWLRTNKARRFFAYVHVREPHFPYDPPPPFDTLFGPEGPIGKARRRQAPKGQPRLALIGDINQGRRPFSEEEFAHLVRLYDGNLAFADQQVGVLRKTLEGEGLWQKTIVIVTADHGQAFREHGFIGHNAQLYEESVRVPLIVRMPGFRGGRRISALVDLTDLAPTVADIFGALGQGGSDREFRGRSLLPVLAGQPGKPVVLSRTVQRRPLYAIRDDRYKLIHDTARGAEELYDVVADPAESRNLVSSDPLRAAFYREALLEWISEAPRAKRQAEEKTRLTAEECEGLQALGYVGVPGCAE